MRQEELSAALAAICGGDYVQAGDGIDSALLTDWTHSAGGVARAAVFPATVAEVAAILTLCNTQRIPVIPQGGNTGMCGGAVPLTGCAAEANGVILALRRLCAVRALDTAGRTITVEAGCILEKVQAAAAAQGLFFPLTLGAKGSCQLGGNLATNAGGLNVLRYGCARDLCLGVEAVLADGRVLNGLSLLHKNTAGYDLRHLLIGSEGTLAVITAATLKLFPPPRVALTAWVMPPSPQKAMALLSRIQYTLPTALVAFEMLPARMLSLLATYQPALRLPFRGVPPPWLVLLEAADVERAEIEEVLLAALNEGLADDVVIAHSEGERAAFWRVREEAPLIQARHGGWLRSDVALPPAGLADFIDEIERRLTAVCEGLYLIGFGHLGDGNLHVSARPLDKNPAEEPVLAEQIKQVLYDCVADYGGTFSAEHGIGQLKTALLPKYKDAAALALMYDIKRALDKNNILNPGKVLS